MTELVLRAGHNDHAVVSDLLTDPAVLPPRLSRLIRRVVVDATAVVGQTGFAAATHASGTQLLVDPQTAFLTTQQDPTDSWARLPFAQSSALDLRDLLDRTARAKLIEQVVEFQVDHGGTAIMPPYLHLSDLTGYAAKVQRLLYAETREYLDHLELGFPVFPLLSVDSRAVSLDPERWAPGLGRLVTTAARHADGPFGLGLSSTTRHNASNLHTASRIWRRAAAVGPFIAWHAGATGGLAVAMGATGYEVGMCTGERYNVRAQQRSRAAVPAPGPRYQGSYVASLGHSLERRVVQQLSDIPGVHQGELGCFDRACCPHGFDSMLGAGRRRHAVRSRLIDLEALASIGARRWMLNHLADRSRTAIISARRIRAAANNSALRIGAYPSEHEAMLNVTQSLVSTARVSGSEGGAA